MPDGVPLLGLQKMIGNRAVTELLADSGTPLPNDAAASMEASFRRDFGDVRLHAGPTVDEAADRIDASAFTVGRDVYIHSNVSDLSSPTGRQILGEELAHVAQGVGTRQVERFSSPAEPLELEAHRAGRAAAAGAPARADASPHAAAVVGRAAGDAESDARQLSKSEKEALMAGAMMPIRSARRVLKDRDPMETVGFLSGVPDFLYQSRGTADDDTLVGAGNFVRTGMAVLGSSVHREEAKQRGSTHLGNLAADIGNVGLSGQERFTNPPGAISPPVGARNQSPAPGAQAEHEALTDAQRSMLLTGVSDPLRWAARALEEANPDYRLIDERLASIIALLASFEAPPTFKEVLYSVGREVAHTREVIRTLFAGRDEAMRRADELLSAATGMLLSVGVPEE